MANIFKNLAAEVATGGLATIYTAPASTQVVVLVMQVANIDGTERTVDAQVTDTSEADTGYLCKDLVLPADSAINLINGRLVLEAGDVLKLNASAAAAVDYNLSILEIT